MAKKHPRASIDTSRLKVLAAGDEAPFREAVIELIDSGDRLAREAALDALAQRPLANLRTLLRALYFELDADRAKRDVGAHVRGGIARVLLSLADVRDQDIGLRATETYESAMGVDATSPLRALGLKIVAAMAPDLLPYVAAEHVDDHSTFTTEPANTALQLLAGIGQYVSVYQWLVSKEEQDASLVAAAVALLAEADAPLPLLSRYVARTIAGQISEEAGRRREEAGKRALDEELLAALADLVVEREMQDAYGALAAMMQASVSNELYGYLALLLAGTNRPALLAILDQEMGDVRRRAAIVAALRVRTTPEQEAILKRWEEVS